jgi:hypothetical protein
VPAGVGVALRPAKNVQNQRPQLHSPPSQPLNPGHMVQDFKFPQVPPPIPETGSSRRARDLVPPQTRRYNMHESYVSSVNEDSATPKTTPRTTPSSKSARWPTPPRESYYPESDYPDSPQAAYPSSRIMPPSEFPTPGQSRGTDSYDEGPRLPPPIATTNLEAPVRPRLGEISPASSRTTAMNALSAAIAAGFSTQPQASPDTSTPPGRTFSPMRMPFEGSSSRPRTPDTREELEAPQLRELPRSNKMLQTPSSAESTQSTNPLLGLGINQPGMSSKVPVNKRPPKLDIDAVRDMEARGSTTSLAELIRRATKLAANLDRGKTASRLGMLDMFGNSDKLGHMRPGDRDSTMSDLMSAFPAPAAGGTPRGDTLWPLGEKGYLVDEQGQHGKKQKKKKRKCCGLSLPVFIAILIIVVVLVAAAVLLPIFLIVVPRQHANHVNLHQCPTSYPCRNGGTSIVSNNACNCVCSNGFTGGHCDVAGSPNECTTMTIADGSNQYKNATMGLSILPVFADARSFDVALNASTILSLFSLNALSCASENEIVNFNSSTPSTASESNSNAKRFIMLADFGAGQAPTPLPTPSPHLRRQNVASSAGIVFAASTTTPSAPSATDTALSTVTSLLSPTAKPSAPPTFSSVDVPQDKLSFAQVVVLYVLQQSTAISVAVNAQQKIQSFFISGNSSATDTVSVGFGELQLTADFGSLTIRDGNGNDVGGG